MGNFGPLVVFGSGETARRGHQVHEELLRGLPVPARIAIVETPAGFQPNVDVVTGKLKDFVEHHLQNYKPEISVVRARRKGGPGDPDDPAVYAPLLDATYVLAGPGSPTYSVRHLAGTKTLALMRERWEQGVGLALSSAMAIAIGTHVLPVYEIYKAGEDPEWRAGLDLLGGLGLNLAIVPHWDNKEGGADLDTSRCFIGETRFQALREMLPRETVVLGVDEHTSCIFEANSRACQVRGLGQVTVIRGSETRSFNAKDEFSFSLLESSEAQLVDSG